MAAPPGPQGWLFNVYLTTISPPASDRHAPGQPPPLQVRRHCVAQSACVDDDGCLLVPIGSASGASLAALSGADGGAPETDARRASLAALHLQPKTTSLISPAALLPWVNTPLQLYGHWLRIEAYSLVPCATKVVDGLVYMGDMATLGASGVGVAGSGAGAPSLQRVSQAVQQQPAYSRRPSEMAVH